MGCGKAKITIKYESLYETSIWQFKDGGIELTDEDVFNTDRILVVSATKAEKEITLMLDLQGGTTTMPLANGTDGKSCSKADPAIRLRLPTLQSPVMLFPTVRLLRALRYRIALHLS